MAKIEKLQKLHRNEYETWENFVEDVNIEEFLDKEVHILEVDNRPEDWDDDLYGPWSGLKIFSADFPPSWKTGKTFSHFNRVIKT